MVRLACIDLPAFPLQILLRRQPSWSDLPVAVVTEDKPQGRILWVNECARRFEVLPGMRYAAARSLTSQLCAGVVSSADVEVDVALVMKRLRSFSPGVEAGSQAGQEPGVFWVNASGLDRLHPSLTAWAEQIHTALVALGFSGRIAIGFLRFGTYALARATGGLKTVLADTPEEEIAMARRVRLDHLSLDPKTDPTRNAALRALGVYTVEDLLRLPAHGISRRFGLPCYRLHRWARGELQVPLQPQPVTERLQQRMELDEPEKDLSRFLFLIKHLLDPLLSALSERQQALAELILRMKFERTQLEAPDERVECLRPADPTLNARLLLNLVLLRLESNCHGSNGSMGLGITEFSVEARGCAATTEQLHLYASPSRRDLTAAKRALARLRAQFGEGAVVRARLQEGHLPEASFNWEPIAEVLDPQARSVSERVLVRRIYERSQAVSLGSHLSSSACRALGPYVVSGGWWRREIDRAYQFIGRAGGDWLWAYRDRKRGRWFLQGHVE